MAPTLHNRAKTHSLGGNQLTYRALAGAVVLGDSFLYCRRCSEAHRISEFDRAPIYRLDGTEVVEESADDRRQFIELHASHGIAEIFATANARMRGQSANPMAIRDVEVSDGQSGFVLRGLRKTIQEPITYRLLPKQLSLWKER